MATAPASPDRTDTELESILTSFDSSYVWNYGCVKEGLRDLYEKAKREQWNGSELLDWSTDVDPESEIIPQHFNPLEDYGPYKKLSPKQVREFRHAQLAWTLSQFLHGEQGAMITASQLVGAVPTIDAKYYASTQTMDEARHTEVFARYLNEKLEWEWPINPNLKSLLDNVLTDGRWDLKFLGMQIVVEGLAMAAFANMYMMAQEPLLKSLLKNVMRDESRHVAFGVLSLRGHYDDMPENERKDREEFLMEACTLMRDRLVGEDIAEHFGFDKEEVRNVVLESPIMQEFRRLIFMRVVPNVKRLGLLTPPVRKHFEELRIIEFEDNDPEAMDRQLGIA
jgi:hypothetical protein